MNHRPLTLLRALTFADGTPLAAASGLVGCGGFLHVVADDRLELASLRIEVADATLGTTRLFPGVLPSAPKERKRLKPDLELLLRLPLGPHGALLALGSGSTHARDRGALVPLAADGAIAGAAQLVDATPLYAALRARLSSLNLEGGAVLGDRLVLLHRGNGAGATPAWIELPLPEVLRALAAGSPLGPGAGLQVEPVSSLGSIDGVPWGFTDATPLPGGALLFSVAAEASATTYDDGRCAGVGLGMRRPGEPPRLLATLQSPAKVEGLHATLRANGDVELWLVTDADDPASPAALLHDVLPAALLT